MLDFLFISPAWHFSRITHVCWVFPSPPSLKQWGPRKKQHCNRDVPDILNLVDTFAGQRTKKALSAGVWAQLNRVIMVLCLLNSVAVQEEFPHPSGLKWLTPSESTCSGISGPFCIFQGRLTAEDAACPLASLQLGKTHTKEDLSVSSQIASKVCMGSCTIFIKSTCLMWKSWRNSKHRTLSCCIFSKQSHTP